MELNKIEFMDDFMKGQLKYWNAANFNLGEVISCYEISYLVGKLQYTILKEYLEKANGRELSDDEINCYCLSLRNNTLSKVKEFISSNIAKDKKSKEIDDLATRYKHINDVNLILLEVQNASSYIKDLNETAIKNMEIPDKIFNVYSCVDGASKFIECRKMGVESFFDEKCKEDEEKQLCKRCCMNEIR
ncbi:MAG: hypothetical protein PHN42_01190 [Bacilli bacterium]|nr:hypothetical protein [Bacilli bacterium]